MAPNDSAEDSHRLPELSSLFADAHVQLLERDRELLSLSRRVIDLLAANRPPTDQLVRSLSADYRQARLTRDLQTALAEQTAWAERAAEEVGQRDETIRRLQARLAHLQLAIDEQTAWAKRSAEEVLKRDETIRQFQATLPGRVAGLVGRCVDSVRRRLPASL